MLFRVILYLPPMIREKGLTSLEAQNKLKEFGKNQIREVKKATAFDLLIRQFKNNYILYLLIGAAAISFVVGKGVTGYTLIVVVLIVIVTGFVQEYRAEKAIDALKQMLQPKTRVIRDGKEVEILSIDIVPGDIILLKAGEKVPADGVIIDDNQVRVDESILTGESREVAKTVSKEIATDKEEHKIFMGTFVVSGNCDVVVTHTGMNTKFGGIAGMVSMAEKDLPLQDKINKISTYMVIVALVVSFLMGALLFFRADQINGEFLTSTLILMVALAVSAFPQGLPLVMVTTLAVGAQKMASKNAIINRMTVVESLGEATVICTDKTGTITTGEMTVRKLVLDGKTLDITGSGFDKNGEFLNNGEKVDTQNNQQLKELLNAAVICNDAKLESLPDGKFKPIGSATEAALLILAAKAGVTQEELNPQRIEELSFTSERKMMSVIVEHEGVKKVFVKGAPEVVLSKCTEFLEGNKKIKMTEKEHEHFTSETKEMASKAFRTLAFAYKEVSASTTTSYDEENLTFLGITGMEDPARPEVKTAIATCKGAGIKVKLITGDNRETAVAVAAEVGIEGKVMSGEELDRLTDEELKDEVGELSIFVRVRPEHKLRIVKALKANEEIVAMTGDGVNDAPALKEAHIGIAMGIKGTDVSRSVADIVLRDDNFATIVTAIAEGRTIFSNIRKFVSYDLSCNFAELMILFFGVLLTPVFGWEAPVLAAIQILFMNLVTDNLPAFSLAFNPSSSDVLRERPKRKAEIIYKETIILILATGFIMCLGTLITHYISFNIFTESVEVARTSALVTLIVIEIGVAFVYRSFRKKVLTRSPFVNKYLFLASVVSILATIAIVYWRQAGEVFETVPISINAWIIAFVTAFVIVVIFDIGKELNKHFRFLQTH